MHEAESMATMTSLVSSNFVFSCPKPHASGPLVSEQRAGYVCFG